MSTIIADNLTGKTSAGSITVTSEGGAATQSLQQGLAKAWVNFNGTGTLAVGDSLNISSVTDSGTGDYDINISNTFASANYSATVSAYPHGSWNQVIHLQVPTNNSGNIYSVMSASDSGTYYDSSLVNSSVHGDLA